MNKRKITLTVVLIAVVVFPVLADDATKSVELILREIKMDQNVGEIKQIDPDRVNDPRLVELGEALMELMVPNERQHELMDQMMGGEGSESLEAMHRSMGYSYLSGGGEASWRSGWGMMGPGMMNNWQGHMLSASPLIWVLIVILAAAAVVLAILLAVHKHQGTGRSSEGAREVLQQRCASGEISRDEYLQILNDVS
jgi:uncharacterized membrane protein